MSTGSFRPDLTSSSAHIYSITDGIASGKSDLGCEAFNSSIKLLSGIWEQQASKSSETPAIVKAVTDAEATLPNLVFFAPAKPKEFSVSEDAFGQFGEEPAKLLRDNKAKRISLVGDSADDSGDKMSLLFEFKEPQEINMDPNTGCRKITISNTPRAHISFEPDGTIKLSNISGIRAEVNPGEDPLFGIKPWITVKVDTVTLSKNKDGALEIEVTGSKGLLDHTKTIPVSDQMAKHITALMDALPNVAEASKGDIPKEVREIMRKGPEDDDGGYLVPTLIGTGALALLYALRKAANKEKPAPLDATPSGKPAHPETIVSRAHGMELALSNIDATVGKHPLSPNQVKGWLKFPGENGETYLVSPDRERVAVSVPSPNGTGEYIYLQPEMKVRAAKPDWDVDNKVRQQAQSGLEAALPKIVGQLAEVANQWPEKGKLPIDAIQEFGEKAPIIQLRRKQIEGKLGTPLTEQQWQDANYMRGILDKDPAALEKYNECHELRTKAESQWHAIQSAVAKPLAEMEKRINLELAKKNLPPVSLELAPLPEPGSLVRAQFGYLAGQGKVLIGPEQAVKGFNQDFLGSLSHEVKHAEQDSLIIRKYAAEEARDGTTGKALLEKMQARYKEEFKINLSERYAADILATPGALKLTKDELKRANELESAIKAQPKVLLELHRELARAEKISLAIDICAQPTGLSKIMSSLSKPETLTQLFGTKPVPEDVAKIVQLHLDIAANKRPATDWNEAEARRVIIPALQESRMECLTKADLGYRKLFHEQEARCTETDTVDLAKHHNIPPLTQSDGRTDHRSPAALSLPMGGSSDATGEGMPKPDPIKSAETERELEELLTPLSQPPEVERLAKAKDISGLAKLAQTTSDVTVATTAVREIAKALPKNAKEPPLLFDLGGSEGQLSAEQILNKLAKGNSCAAAEAMMQCSFLDPKSGHDLYKQRLANGDLEQLWQQGKLNADRILQHFSQYAEAKDVIARLTKFAEDKPELRLELARTLVEPARYEFFGGPFRIMAATNEQRAAAIETLAKDGSKASQDALVGMLKKCTDPILRDLATTELMKHWQSDRVDGTSVCSLLKGNQLLDFVRNTAGMQFSEPANMDQLYSRYQAAKDFYDNGGPADEMKEARRALDAALQPRKEALKKQVDALTDSLGLPRTKLAFVETLENANGTYHSGKGSIEILELDLCKNGRIAPQLVATIAHEVLHHEQDTLMVKAACDYVLGDSLVADQSARDRISTIYESGTGTAALKTGTGKALTPELLEAVLKQRNGQLSEPERQRANTLMDSTHDLVQNHKQQTILEAQLRRLDSNLRYLRQGLLSVVVDENGRPRNSSISITEETTINAVKKYFKLPEGAEGKEEALRTATDWLIDDLSKERAKLAKSLHQTYKTRAHEVESHEVSARAIVMTEVVTKGLPTPAALSQPLSGTADRTSEGMPKPDPIKSAQIERELEKLRIQMARKQDEILVREENSASKERELQKLGNDQRDTADGERRYREIVAERDNLKAAHARKIGELQQERDALNQKYRQLEMAKAIADGYFPPGEYMVAFPGKDAVKLCVGKESIEEKNGKIVQRSSGKPVLGEHVHDLLEAIKAAGIVPDRVLIFDNANRKVGEGGIRQNQTEFAGKPASIYEIYINTGVSNQPVRMIYNHETGHLYDYATVRTSVSVEANQKIEEAYKAGLNKEGSPAEVAAKYMKIEATESWKAQFNKDMLDPKNRDILSDRLNTQENRLKYLCSRSEVFAEMFKLYQEQLRITRETGAKPSYKDLLEHFTAPSNPVRAEMMRNFEPLYSVLSTETFPQIKPLAEVKPTTPNPLGKDAALSLPDDQRVPGNDAAAKDQRPPDFDVPDAVRQLCQSQLEKRVADIVKSAAAVPGWPDSLNKDQVLETKRAARAKSDARVLLDQTLQDLYPGPMPTETQLHDRQYMRTLLKDSEFEYELKAYEMWVKQSDRFDAANKALNQPYEASFRDLEKRINRQLAAADLPPITLEIGVDMFGLAEHIPGSGKIRIAADQLKGGSLSVELLGYITHELKHAEQDALIVRKYGMEAARLGLTGDELIAKVQERYLTDHKFALDYTLAKDIFSKEGALKLTAAEQARADLLLKSFLDKEEVDRKHEKLLTDHRRILESRTALGKHGASVVASQLLRYEKPLGDFAQDKDLRRILDLRQAIDNKTVGESKWNDQEAKEILNRVLTARAVQLGEQADRVYSDQLHEQEARVTESLGVNVARTVVPEHQLSGRRPERKAEPSRRVNFSELTADIDKFGTLQNGQESTAQDFHNLVAKSFIEGQASLRNDPLFEKLQVTEGAEAKLKFTHKGQQVEPLYRDQNNLILKDGKSIPISEITIEAQLPKNLFDALGNAQTRDQSLTELNAKFGSMLMQVDNISTRQERAKALTGDADVTAKLTEVAKTDQEAERRAATELATVKPMQPLAERTAVEPSGLVGTQTEQKVAEQEVAVEGGLLVVRNTDGTTEKLEDRAFNEIFEASRKAANERLQKLRADPKTDPNLIAQAEKELAEMKAQQELLMRPTPEGRAFRERFSKAASEYVKVHGKTIGKGVGLGCSLLIAVNAVCRQFTADGKPK